MDKIVVQERDRVVIREVVVASTGGGGSDLTLPNNTLGALDPDTIYQAVYDMLLSFGFDGVEASNTATGTRDAIAGFYEQPTDVKAAIRNIAELAAVLLAQAAGLARAVLMVPTLVDAEAALARDASNLTSGTVADARIPSSVTRDSELTAGLATKEDVGVAATLIAAEPELDDGYGTILDTSVPGFVSIKRATNKLAAAVTSVSNTTTETTVLAAAVALSAEDRVFTTTFDLVLSGQYTNNSGSNKDVTFRVKLAGTTIMTFGFTAIPTSATARAFTLRASFGFQNFIGSRAQGMGVMTLGAAGAGLDFGGISKAADTTPTFTLGSAISLDVTAQHSAAATTVIALGLGGSIRRGSD